MPIVRIESSIHLAQEHRTALLSEISACIVRNLGVHPRQVRALIEEIDPAAALVGEQLADATHPWLVAWVSILAGRSEEKRIALLDDLGAVLAAGFGVDDSAVRTLIHEYPNIHWGLGRQPAPAPGR
jgi:phenylpyruvate tautomerase PptA (4-oxalocrotonate tautomerase family)